MRTALLACAMAASGCGGDGGDADAPVADAVTGCPSATPWAAAPALPIGPTQETAAVALDGKIYVLGGFNGALGVVADVQVFDTVTCAWSAGPALPRAVHHANAAVAGGRIYVLGALVGTGFAPVGDTWSWRPGEASWTAHASMPPGSERGSAVTGVVGARIVVAGGLRGGAVSDVAAYDPAADRWDTALPPLPARRDHACGAVVGGRGGEVLVVAGGRQAAITSIAAEVYAFDGAAWTPRAPMPTARGGAACGVVGERLIVVGGEGNPATASRVFGEVEAYLAGEDRWERLEMMRTPRHGMGAASWGGKLYVPGGATEDGFAATAIHEVLTP